MQLSKRILVVDDDTQIVEILVDLLEGSGYEVSKAFNGDEAIAQYRANPADLMIIDMMMPIKNGLDAIRELRLDFPEARIIAITGGLLANATKNLGEASNLGVLCTFKKPFDLMDLLSTVNAVLSEMPS